MKILILAIAALAVIVGSAFFIGSNSTSLIEVAPANVLEDTGEKPWIEVISGKVFEFDQNGKLVRELKTGDTIEEKRVLDAGTGTLANIYFGDGSVLKIDSETKIEIWNGMFEKESGKLSVKIQLVLGRIYSQIKNLATVDSEWQVETPNAIAAVRGTAFGVEFSKGKSTVIVVENKVEVAAKDLATNKIIESSKTIVKEKELVTLLDKDIPQIINERKTLKIEKVGDEMLNRVWIKRSIKTEKPVETLKVEEVKNINTQKPETAAPKEIKITSQTPLEKILEGENIKLEVILILSDGSEKKVTTEVSWQTLGGIGTVSRDGNFSAKLDSSVSEFGSAFGNIIGIWKDPATGNELLGKTPIFKVDAQILKEEINDSLEPRG